MRGDNTLSRIWLCTGGFPTAHEVGASFPSLAFLAHLRCYRGWEAEPSCTASLRAHTVLLTVSQHTLPELSTGGSCFLAYDLLLTEYLVAPTHTENCHELLKDPDPYFVAQGKLRCNARHLFGPDPSPHCSTWWVRRVWPILPQCTACLLKCLQLCWPSLAMAGS